MFHLSEYWKCVITTLSPVCLLNSSSERFILRQTSNVHEFGLSWTSALDEVEDDPSCAETCEGVPDTEKCDGDDLNRAEEHCSSLIDPDGPFKVVVAFHLECCLSYPFMTCSQRCLFHYRQ